MIIKRLDMLIEFQRGENRFSRFACFEHALPKRKARRIKRPNTFLLLISNRDLAVTSYPLLSARQIGVDIICRVSNFLNRRPLSLSLGSV